MATHELILCRTGQRVHRVVNDVREYLRCAGRNARYYVDPVDPRLCAPWSTLCSPRSTPGSACEPGSGAGIGLLEWSHEKVWCGLLRSFSPNSRTCTPTNSRDVTITLVSTSRMCTLTAYY